MIKKPISMFLISFILLLNLCVSVKSLQIAPLAKVNNLTFYPGNSVDLGTVLINNESSEVNLTAEQYLIYPGIDPMPLYEDFIIPAKNDTMIADMSFDVSDNSKSGEYVHVVRVYEGDKIVAEKTRTFFVQAAEERLSDVDVVICADQACGDVRPVFVVGETAYIKVESSQNPDVRGFIEFPKGNFIGLSFSGNVATFKADSVGNYSVWVLLFREGFAYEEIEKKITFLSGVKKPTYYFCNETEDGVCETCQVGEDPDCMQIAEANNFYVMAAIIAAVVIAVALLAFWKIRGKAGKE